MHPASGDTPTARPEPDDWDTLLAARDGDRRAGELLVRRHGASMLRTAWSVAGRNDGSGAEDAVQEALIAALTTSALPRGDLGAWLRAITVRKALDGLRRTSRRAECSLETSVEGPIDVASPEREATTVDVLAVRAALGRLAPRDRAVLTLVDLEGFSMAEAARALGSTTMAVKWRAVRARRRLRSVLEGGAVAQGSDDDA